MAGSRSSTAALHVWLAVGAAMLSACASDPPKLEGAAATAGFAGQAKSTQGTFNPFADPTAPAPGGRVVIANPTPDDIFAPAPVPEMALGKPNAPVTIVQYASLTCPHCRNFHKTIFPQFKKAYIDTGKVRYVLRDFPIGKQSGNATIALRCAAPDKYFELYAKFMEQQASWVSQEVRLDPIFAVAKQSGLKRADFDACLKNEKFIADLNWVKEHGRKLGIIGTPNYFVGTTLVKKELTMADIRAMVDPMLTGTIAAR